MLKPQLTKSLAPDVAKSERQAQAAAILRPQAGTNLARAWS
jgi:hypothetical protein